MSEQQLREAKDAARKAGMNDEANKLQRHEKERGFRNKQKRKGQGKRKGKGKLGLLLLFWDLFNNFNDFELDDIDLLDAVDACLPFPPVLLPPGALDPEGPPGPA